jgi:hypothetical protein
MWELPVELKASHIKVLVPIARKVSVTVAFEVLVSIRLETSC